MVVNLLHEGTLLGAIDSYLKGLVHVRPHLTKRFEGVLEEMAERWLEEGRVNSMAAVDSAWLTAYLEQAPDRRLARQVIHDFYRWAHKHGLSEVLVESKI